MADSRDPDGPHDSPEADAEADADAGAATDADAEVETAPDDGDDGWRFGVDEVGEDADPEPAIEPESPSPENALFVAVGVLLAVLIVLTAL